MWTSQIRTLPNNYIRVFGILANTEVRPNRGKQTFPPLADTKSVPEVGHFTKVHLSACAQDDQSTRTGGCGHRPTQGGEQGLNRPTTLVQVNEKQPRFPMADDGPMISLCWYFSYFSSNVEKINSYLQRLWRKIRTTVVLFDFAQT